MFKVGDKVIPDPAMADRIPHGCLGKVYTVTKVNPKNIQASADDGGRGINFPAAILKPYDPTAPAIDQMSRPFVPREIFVVGDIVTFVIAPKGRTTETPFVVIKTDDRKVNVALLGGDEDRYFRVPYSGLKKQTTEWLATQLLETL